MADLHGNPKITAPAAKQHKTAGPYSPVVMVKADEIVVISGQVAVDMDGNVVGKTIEEQTAAMLENCRTQIANGGCSFHDVFKVNVYLTDLAMWDRFNGVYKSVMPQPYPARTAVQAALLDDFIVEIEMWAAKP